MFKGSKVAVIGDLILDEYISGEVARISPEAPVPVHLAKETHFQAGGAANSALNIHLCGGTTYLFGFCGKDAAGNELNGILKSHKMDTSNIINIAECTTIKKTRVTSGRQQIVRIDWEENFSISESNLELFYKNLDKSDFDVMLISDYGKGFLTASVLFKIIAIALKKKAKIVVDPKSQDFSVYAGSDYITPNLKESQLAAGLPNCKNDEQLAAVIRSKYKIKNLLITQGSKGMSLFTENGEKLSISAHSREVYDVSGAGDTVAAIFSAGLAAKKTPEQAMELANIAAGVVVQKWGTQPVMLSEIEAEMSRREGLSTQYKIRELSSLMSILGKRDTRKKKVVFTNGCFDVLHFGHLSYLEKARELGDILVVGINTDASVKILKGEGRPVNVLEHRARLLAGLSCVDFVVSFNEETPVRLISDLLPDVLVKGADYKIDEIVGAKEVLESGGIVTNIDLIPGLSSSDILGKI